MRRSVRFVSVPLTLVAMVVPWSSIKADFVTLSDDFESATLNPFWSTFALSGAVDFPSTAVVHGGTQSVALRTISTGQNMEVQLFHNFVSPTYGTASVWMFDAVADQPSGNYLAFYLTDATGFVAGIATQDFDFGPSTGGTYNYSISGSDGIDTEIDRTQNWHHLLLTSLPNKLEISIDDSVVYSSTNGIPFTRLTMNVHAPGFRPGVTAYWDDASVTGFSATPVPEPSTLVIFASGVCCWLVVGCRRRPERLCSVSDPG